MTFHYVFVTYFFHDNNSSPAISSFVALFPLEINSTLIRGLPCVGTFMLNKGVDEVLFNEEGRAWGVKIGNEVCLLS